MKFVKFGAFALALGMFAVSCNEEKTETTTTGGDTTTVVAPAPVVVEPAAPAAPMTTDSNVKVETKVDGATGDMKTETKVETEKK